MRRSGQAFLPGFSWKGDSAHGGGNSRTTHPRSARPFHPRADLHVVIRSERARGPLSMLRRATRVGRAVRSVAARAHVELKDYVNVGNHLHLRLRARSRASLQAFLRALTGLLARILLKRERGVGARANAGVAAPRESFWDARPYSRIVDGAGDGRALSHYFHLNRLETSGVTKRMNAEMVALFRQNRELAVRDG